VCKTEPALSMKTGKEGTMDTVDSRLTDEVTVARIKGWLTRSVQGHLLVNWHCPACGRWHINGWRANGEDGIRVSPKCLHHHRGGAFQVVLLDLHGDATPEIMCAIKSGQVPIWDASTKWPQRLLGEEAASVAPPPVRPRQPERRRILPPRSSVPARTWRAAAEGIIAACLAGRADTADKRTTARIERDAYRLLHQIERDPISAWRQLVEQTAGDLDAGIVAAMR
jgi:hypothetical protein